MTVGAEAGVGVGVGVGIGVMIAEAAVGVGATIVETVGQVKALESQVASNPEAEADSKSLAAMSHSLMRCS